VWKVVRFTGETGNRTRFCNEEIGDVCDGIFGGSVTGIGRGGNRDILLRADKR
jgi:hypothetical protein